MSRRVTREVSFHRVFTENVKLAQSRDRKKREQARHYVIDWRELLESVPEVGEARSAEGSEDPSLGFMARPALDPPVLSIFRPAKPGFSVLMKHGGEAGGLSIEELQSSENFDLANATAYFFLPSPPGVLAVMQGDPSGSSPPATALLHVLDAIAPQGDDRDWKVKPLRAPSELDQLKLAQGVHRARWQAAQGETLLSNPNDPELGHLGNAGAATISRALQNRLGFPVEVTVDLKIPKDYRLPKHERELKELFVREAEAMMFEGEPPKVYAVRPASTAIENEVLTLGEHRVTTRVVLEQSEGEGLSFTKLVNNTAEFLARGGESFIRRAMGDEDGEKLGR